MMPATSALGCRIRSSSVVKDSGSVQSVAEVAEPIEETIAPAVRGADPLHRDVDAIEVTDRLKSCVKQSDTVARTAGTRLDHDHRDHAQMGVEPDQADVLLRGGTLGSTTGRRPAGRPYNRAVFGQPCDG